MSTYDILNFPSDLALWVVIVAFFLSIAPYAAGFNFGLFRVPDFSEITKRRLKVVGPVALLSSLMMHFPVWSPTENGELDLGGPLPVDPSSVSVNLRFSEIYCKDPNDPAKDGDELVIRASGSVPGDPDYKKTSEKLKIWPKERLRDIPIWRGDLSTDENIYLTVVVEDVDETTAGEDVLAFRFQARFPAGEGRVSIIGLRLLDHNKNELASTEVGAHIDERKAVLSSSYKWKPEDNLVEYEATVEW